MRVPVIGSLGVLAVCSAMVLLLWPKAGEAPSVRDVQAPLTRDDVARARAFPSEPVKRDLRDVGGGKIAGLRIEADEIERLPARPLLPKKPRPPAAELPAVPVSIPRPLIKAPGHLEGNDYRVRLAGIRSPTLDAQCEGHPCGRLARTAMRRFVRGRTVICTLPRTPDKAVHEAACSVGGKDIAGWLVTQGWALPDGEAAGDTILQAGETARAKRRGLWRGGFDAAAVVSPPKQSVQAASR